MHKSACLLGKWHGTRTRIANPKGIGFREHHGVTCTRVLSSKLPPLIERLRCRGQMNDFDLRVRDWLAFQVNEPASQGVRWL